MIAKRVALKQDDAVTRWKNTAHHILCSLENTCASYQIQTHAFDQIFYAFLM